MHAKPKMGADDLFYSALGLEIGRKLKSLYLTSNFVRGGPQHQDATLDHDAPLDSDGQLWVEQNNILK